MPQALKSVSIETIRKWEHCVWRWIDAYENGLDAQDAQIHVCNFSSHQYTSHRRIPEAVAQGLDIM